VGAHASPSQANALGKIPMEGRSTGTTQRTYKSPSAEPAPLRGSGGEKKMETGRKFNRDKRGRVKENTIEKAPP